MKRNSFVFLFIFILISSVYAQRIPVVGVMVFEASGSGISSAEIMSITDRVIAELSSWGTLNVVRGSAGAEYIIRGTVARQGAFYVLSGVTVDAAAERTLNEYREQVAVGDNVSLFTFCTRAVERVPFPNYLIGTWRSTLDMPDGPLVCVIEFRSDRTVRVERYDTWEHRQNNTLRYEGFGGGSYSYAGFGNRVITVNAQQIRIDATISVNLNLEETLPEQTAVNRSGLSLVFSGDKNSFNIVNGALPCGMNYGVNPPTSLGFTSFTKIR